MGRTDLCTRENIKKQQKTKTLLHFILVIFLLERDFTHWYTLNYFTILDFFFFVFLMLLSFEIMESRKHTLS